MKKFNEQLKQVEGKDNSVEKKSTSVHMSDI